jgi:hypothetical protein
VGLAHKEARAAVILHVSTVDDYFTPDTQQLFTTPLGISLFSQHLG